MKLQEILRFRGYNSNWSRLKKGWLKQKTLIKLSNR